MSAIDRVELSLNRTTKPFQGKTDFLPVDLSALIDCSWFENRDEDLLRTDIEFQGLSGHISAKTGASVLTTDARTPLGKVRSEIEIDNTKVSVLALPLYLTLGFTINTIKDFDQLMLHTPRLDLGNERYYLKFDGETARDEEGNPLTRSNLDKWLSNFKSPFNLEGDRLLEPVRYRDGSETRTPVLLPYNIATISDGVNLTMIEKPAILTASRSR